MIRRKQEERNKQVFVISLTVATPIGDDGRHSATRRSVRAHVHTFITRIKRKQRQTHLMKRTAAVNQAPRR